MYITPEFGQTNPDTSYQYQTVDGTIDPDQLIVPESETTSGDTGSGTDTYEPSEATLDAQLSTTEKTAEQELVDRFQSLSETLNQDVSLLSSEDITAAQTEIEDLRGTISETESIDAATADSMNQTLDSASADLDNAIKYVDQNIESVDQMITLETDNLQAALNEASTNLDATLSNFEVGTRKVKSAEDSLTILQDGLTDSLARIDADIATLEANGNTANKDLQALQATRDEVVTLLDSVNSSLESGEDLNTAANENLAVAEQLQKDLKGSTAGPGLMKAIKNSKDFRDNSDMLVLSEELQNVIQDIQAIDSVDLVASADQITADLMAVRDQAATYVGDADFGDTASQMVTDIDNIIATLDEQVTVIQDLQAIEDAGGGSGTLDDAAAKLDELANMVPDPIAEEPAPVPAPVGDSGGSDPAEPIDPAPAIEAPAPVEGSGAVTDAASVDGMTALADGLSAAIAEIDQIIAEDPFGAGDPAVGRMEELVAQRDAAQTLLDGINEEIQAGGDLSASLESSISDVKLLRDDINDTVSSNGWKDNGRTEVVSRVLPILDDAIKQAQAEVDAASEGGGDADPAPVGDGGGGDADPAPVGDGGGDADPAPVGDGGGDADPAPVGDGGGAVSGGSSDDSDSQTFSANMSEMDMKKLRVYFRKRIQTRMSHVHKTDSSHMMKKLNKDDLSMEDLNKSIDIGKLNDAFVNKNMFQGLQNSLGRSSDLAKMEMEELEPAVKDLMSGIEEPSKLHKEEALRDSRKILAKELTMDNIDEIYASETARTQDQASDVMTAIDKNMERGEYVASELETLAQDMADLTASGTATKTELTALKKQAVALRDESVALRENTKELLALADEIEADGLLGEDYSTALAEKHDEFSVVKTDLNQRRKASMDSIRTDFDAAIALLNEAEATAGTDPVDSGTVDQGAGDAGTVDTSGGDGTQETEGFSAEDYVPTIYDSLFKDTHTTIKETMASSSTNYSKTFKQFLADEITFSLEADSYSSLEGKSGADLEAAIYAEVEVHASSYINDQNVADALSAEISQALTELYEGSGTSGG